MTDRLFESHVTTNFNEDFREEFLYWPQKKFYPAYFKMITSKACHRLVSTNHRLVRSEIFINALIRFRPESGHWTPDIAVLGRFRSETVMVF